MANLTIRNIKDARYKGDGKSRDVRWDSELRGFGVRVYPSNRKAFVISYRADGRKRMMVLGDFPTLTLTQARKRARRHLVDVQDGVDPLEERRLAVQGETFRDLRVRPRSLCSETKLSRHQAN